MRRNKKVNIVDSTNEMVVETFRAKDFSRLPIKGEFVVLLQGIFEVITVVHSIKEDHILVRKMDFKEVQNG